ncbi:MAG TPA: CoA transferase [Paracoccaceae bacterium]|nr:CoA transferase [Paracoccaceae bacterium]
MLPLTGLRILAVEQYGAGPFGTMLLADMGAEIIKIENPGDGGDMARAVGPHFMPDGSSQFFHSFNRNKRSLTLDLKAPEGRALFLKLVATADAVLDNLRGTQPAKLGLDYAALGQANPRIVCAHLSAYGRDGPRASWPGFDYLMQAEAGYLSVTGEPDGPPARFGLSVVDMMTGLMAAFGLATAVIGARATGKGMDVDTSLFDTALHNVGYLATWYLNAGHVQGREPRGGHPSLVPSQLYPTADGWIFIMCNKEVFWPVLAEKLGRPEWGTDPRFARFAHRLANKAELNALLDAEFAKRSTAEWLDHLQGAVPCAPVFDVEQALANPFVAESDRIAEFDGPAPVRMLRGPVRVAGAEPPCRAGPALGADSDAILSELGLDAVAIADLRTRGIV